MKILHTADWHLGKKIEGKSMLENQKAALSELNDIACREGVDAIVIAGDVFDTAVPSSEAEQLFYSCCVALSSPDRAVVAIAGNHDDEVRLCAARSLAKEHNVYLVGDADNSFFDGDKVKGGDGWLKISTSSGTLNLGLLPYPAETVTAGGEDEYVRRVQSEMEKCTSAFAPGEVNVLAAHLFMLDGSEEKTLGGARILPSDILPSSASYVALGHVHKCMRVCSAPPAYYSGSLVPCNFTETQERCVKLVSFGDGGELLEVRDIALKKVKRLVKIPVANYKEAYDKLSECGDYAEIMYDCPDAVEPSAMAALRAMPAFVKFTPCFVRSEEKSRGRKLMNDDQLFDAFYKSRYGSAPDDEEKLMFYKAVNGEELYETDKT